MGYVEIYDEYQTKYETSNRIKFKAFLDIFKKETGINISSLASVYNVDITDPAKEFYFLKWVLFIYNRKYIPYFYELLDNFGYDMFSEVIDTMKLIGKDTHKNVASDIISYALISPYVDEITVDNGKKGLITIHSNELGDYSFYPSRVYLNNNEGALKLINKYETEGFCHQMSWELMNYHEKCTLVTSLLPLYFEGTHYHTIMRNEEGLVVDASSEAVYTEDVRDTLFKPKDICITEKEDIERKLEFAIEAEDEESKNIDFPNAMLITLHEQSKGLR